MSENKGWFVEGTDRMGRHIDTWGPFDTEDEADEFSTGLFDSGVVGRTDIWEDFKDGRKSDLD